MEKSGNQKPMQKGELSAEFGRTSIGTSSQDEKNMLLPSPDGEASFIPRRDTYAYTAYERSKRNRLDHDKKRSFQHILFMINHLHKSIEAELAQISDIIDDMFRMSENALNLIEVYDMQIENMLLDHRVLQKILDQNSLSEAKDNEHIKAILQRYESRTNSTITDHQLKAILLAQISFEQNYTVPDLQEKLLRASKLYDEIIAESQKRADHKQKMESNYEDIKNNPDDEQKSSDLERLDTVIKKMKEESKRSYDKLKAEFEDISNNDIHSPSSISEPDHDNEQSLNLASIGLGIQTPSSP